MSNSRSQFGKLMNAQLSHFHDQHFVRRFLVKPRKDCPILAVLNRHRPRLCGLFVV